MNGKKTKKGKVPYYITVSSKKIMSFAGLYEHWKGPDGKLVNSFTIITTTANQTMEPLHDRMPAILLDEEIGHWLNPANEDTNNLQELLRPYPSDDIQWLFRRYYATHFGHVMPLSMA